MESNLSNDIEMLFSQSFKACLIFKQYNEFIKLKSFQIVSKDLVSSLVSFIEVEQFFL